MNRLFSILLLLCTLASLNVKAKSDSHNYIVKSSMLDEQGQISVVMVEYYDGLGRTYEAHHTLLQKYKAYQFRDMMEKKYFKTKYDIPNN